MSNEKNGALVNVLKKAVGIPTGNSSCCGTPATGGGCCSPAPAAKESPDAKAESSCCGR